uniref:Putative secreted protein n=1 Tax=Amblyomma triste TaxID=251400 RepID=A0A023G183_AMBTT
MVIVCTAQCLLSFLLFSKLLCAILCQTPDWSLSELTFVSACFLSPYSEVGPASMKTQFPLFPVRVTVEDDLLRVMSYANNLLLQYIEE